MHRQETLLQVLPSESPTSRVSMWMVRCEFSGESRLRMRQESYSDDVGWFTQTHLDLTPDQLSQLKGGQSFRAPSWKLPRRAEGRPAREEGSRAASAEILKLPSVMAG